MDDPLLTPAEVIEWLKISERTLDRWRALKTGPDYVRIGGQVRYRRADVERWLQTYTTPAKR